MSLDWTVCKFADADDLAAEWDSLNAAVTRQPMQDFIFWKMLLQYFGSGNELVCLCRREGRPIAGTVIDSVGKGRWESVAPAQAPMGAWISSGEVPVDRLLAALAAALPGRGLSIGLTRLDPTFESRPANADAMSSMDYILTGSISWTAGFDSYWQRRGRNLRHNLKRQRNRLERQRTATKLESVKSPQLTPGSVDDYGCLESTGWKGQSGTALHPDNMQGRFYRELFEHYSRQGESIAYKYYFNSVLVAMDLCLRRDGVLTILKTTHDEQQTETSPALLMRQESVGQMLDEDGVQRIEFYGKQMDWHTKWTEDFRMMYHLNYDQSRTLRWWRKLKRQYSERRTNNRLGTRS